MMKKTENMLAASILAITFALSPIAVYAGAGHDDELMVFDPTETEFGQYKPKMHVTKTIEIIMSDQMRFSPSLVNVKKGDVIKFVHSNPGQMMHEFVLGTPDSLVEHAQMMKRFPGMEHSEPYMTHVAPGKKGEVIWQFSEAGEFSFGCLIPGHFDAGMKGKIVVGS
ncbi:MAG: putative cupredoxin-like copper-binding protein [Gammaproteobacteria bacterium]|jgi:uncharacterized cupredoxin-like copper-binding protein